MGLFLFKRKKYQCSFKAYRYCSIWRKKFRKKQSASLWQQ